jgi:hypothetical protein
MVKSFTDYFKVTYSYWENIRPAIVELDGNPALITYHKKQSAMSKTPPVTDTSVFAWTSVI